MVNSREESSLLNEDVKCFLIEYFGHDIKFSESKRNNKSNFLIPVATKIEDAINITVKSTAEVIKELLLEVDHNLDGSFCNAQPFKQSWKQTKVLVSLWQFSLF